MPGQTLGEIRSLLAAAGLAPQHRFGQNFLIDLNLLGKLVTAAEVTAADTILEVGPGTGSLTECLLACGARVIAVEIDHGLQRLLRQRLGDNPRFTLVQGDALAGKHRVNPLALKILQDQPPEPGGHYKLVANLPYQIATPLLVDLLHVTPTFERLVCTIQREVGQRLAAPARDPQYGPVSVMVQLLADVTPLAVLPPSVFWPQPQIESVMLVLRPRPAAQTGVTDPTALAAFVQRGFQQRRKMLRRVFREVPDELALQRAFAQAKATPDARAEELSPEQWRALFDGFRLGGLV